MLKLNFRKSFNFLFSIHQRGRDQQILTKKKKSYQNKSFSSDSIHLFEFPARSKRSWNPLNVCFLPAPERKAALCQILKVGILCWTTWKSVGSADSSVSASLGCGTPCGRIPWRCPGMWRLLMKTNNQTNSTERLCLVKQRKQRMNHERPERTQRLQGSFRKKKKFLKTLSFHLSGRHGNLSESVSESPEKMNIPEWQSYRLRINVTLFLFFPACNCGFHSSKQPDESVNGRFLRSINPWTVSAFKFHQNFRNTRRFMSLNLHLNTDGFFCRCNNAPLSLQNRKYLRWKPYKQIILSFTDIKRK